MHRGKLHPSLPIINNLSFHASPCFNLPFAWNGYLILVGKKKKKEKRNVRFDLSLHSSSLVKHSRDYSRDYSQNSLFLEPLRCFFYIFPRYIYRDRKSDYRISVREVQRLTAFGPKSNSFTISSAEAAVVEFVCQRSDRARDQINRKFRAIWLAQYDSLSKNPPLSLFEFHSLSLFRILLQLLYIFLLVRFIHQKKERDDSQYDSLPKNPLSLSLSSNFKNSLSLTNLLQKFIFPHEFSSNSCTFSFVRFSFIKKERERFRPRCIQLIFQAKVIARLFSMLLSQVLMQRDSRFPHFPRESLFNPNR